MDTKSVQEHLKALGWPIIVDSSYGPNTFRTVKNFQRAFSFYDLLIDGQAGNATHTALSKSVSMGGLASDHFKFTEFKCRCGKPSPYCGGDIWVVRELIRGLEVYRQMFGPTSIESGCRCVPHNRAVGGASNSSHLFGGASDLKPKARLNAVRNLRQFSGIGYVRSTGLVRHTDVRGRGGTPNTTSASPERPTLWTY